VTIFNFDVQKIAPVQVFLTCGMSHAGACSCINTTPLQARLVIVTALQTARPAKIGRQNCSGPENINYQRGSAVRSEMRCD